MNSGTVPQCFEFRNSGLTSTEQLENIAVNDENGRHRRLSTRVPHGGDSVQLPPGNFEHAFCCYRCNKVEFVDSSTSVSPWNAFKGDFIQNPSHGKILTAASAMSS